MTDVKARNPTTGGTAAAKSVGDRQRSDRDAQFCYPNEQIRCQYRGGESAVSVETKRRADGRLPQRWAEEARQGESDEVPTHDVVDKERGRAGPCGAVLVKLFETRSYEAI